MPDLSTALRPLRRLADRLLDRLDRAPAQQAEPVVVPVRPTSDDRRRAPRRP